MTLEENLSCCSTPRTSAPPLPVSKTMPSSTEEDAAPIPVVVWAELPREL